jgi:hypothetical protein
MLTAALFFLFAFATIAVLIWCSMELFKNQEDPLGDRLVELQSNAMGRPRAPGAPPAVDGSMKDTIANIRV